MARYRKVDPRIWNDEKFRSLSDNGKLAFLFLLTHPHMTALGAMRGTMPGLASEIGWSEKAFREALGEAFRKAMAKHDEKACFLWLPNFLKYNRPESPNVVKAWDTALDLLPECREKWVLIQHVKDFTEGLTEGFQKALPEAFAKPMPIQEQEQEQEQEQDITPLAPSPEEPSLYVLPTNKFNTEGETFGVTQSMIDEWQEAYQAVDVSQELLRARTWLHDNPTKRKTHNGMRRFLGSWLSRQQDRGGSHAGRQPGAGTTGPQSAVDRVKAATGQQ